MPGRRKRGRMVRWWMFWGWRVWAIVRICW
jgi:hypothetical protein